MRRVFFLIAVAGAALAVASCGPTPSSSQQPLGGRPGGSQGGGEQSYPIEPQSAGQTVFAEQNCTRCHPAPGVKVSGRPKGPDLIKAGEKHDKAWIAEHIRDAKKHNPMSTMPPYPEDKLSAKDLETVSSFLAGLK